MIHNIAHRGASAYEPDNSLRAFERAIDMRATMLELDVHLSRDGSLVVIHDAEISRGASGARPVAELTVDEIQQFDVGQGERVPTLAEVVELVRGRVGLYIELKGQDTPAPVVDLLRARGFREEVIVGSFFPWLPQKVKFLDSSIRTSVLIRGQDREADFLAWALAIEADYVHPCWEHASPTPHKLLTPAMIARIREHGLGLIVWHEERPHELRELAKLDVDGICTNTPDVLAAILAEAGHS
jgi:glycerophosphoryl diester phosphodiesterase